MAPVGASDAYAVAAVEKALWPDIEALLPASVRAEIDAHAGAADAQGEASERSLEILREHGYFGLPVPAEFQGGGADLLACAAVQRELGMADAGLAVALNMHMFSVGMMVEYWRRHSDSSWLLLEAIASQRRIVASAFAEPGLGGSILRSHTRARREREGWLVTGVKSPCSLAGRCDLFCLQMEAEPAEPRGLLVALIPATAPGLRVERTWDALGMRASESDTLRLEDCHIPDSLVLHRCDPGFDKDDVFAAGLLWFCVTTAATYIGLARRAIDEGSVGLRASRLPHLSAVRADLPSVHSQLGEAVAGILALEAACTGVARAFCASVSGATALLPVALAVKHSSAEVCARAVADTAELLGARSYARRGLLARLWRDVQAARFHPPTRLATRQILGRWALDLPFSFELYEQPIASPTEPHA
jgi:alkylation response protein AidB-like acyl-CoA dehydrogenase